jgi:RNA-binding protein YhbY
MRDRLMRVTPTHLRHLEQLHNAAPVGLVMVGNHGVNERVLEELRVLGLAAHDIKLRTYRITAAGENMRQQCVADGTTR